MPGASRRLGTPGRGADATHGEPDRSSKRRTGRSDPTERESPWPWAWRRRGPQLAAQPVEVQRATPQGGEPEHFPLPPGGGFRDADHARSQALASEATKANLDNTADSRSSPRWPAYQEPTRWPSTSLTCQGGAAPTGIAVHVYTRLLVARMRASAAAGASRVSAKLRALLGLRPLTDQVVVPNANGAGQTGRGSSPDHPANAWCASRRCSRSGPRDSSKS